MKRFALFISFALFVSCAGCGTLYPRTVITPQVGRGVELHEAVTGGEDTTTTFEVEIIPPTAPKNNFITTDGAKGALLSP